MEKSSVATVSGYLDTLPPGRREFIAAVPPKKFIARHDATRKR